MNDNSTPPLKHQQSKEKPARKSVPRTRTGCTTCRRRKIKCDEQHPSCSACLRSGWSCPGYSYNPPDAARQTPAASAGIVRIYHLPPTIPGSATVRRDLHYFATCAAGDIGGYFSRAFWCRGILQRCVHDAPVRHAVVALAGLYREYVATSADVAWDGGSREVVEGYGRAMKALRRYVKSKEGGEDVDLRVVMMCSAAFFCFELIRGEQGMALRHLKCGLGVLRSWHGRDDGEHEQMVDVFARMDVQASAFDDGTMLTSERMLLGSGVVEHRAELRGLYPEKPSATPQTAADYSLLLRRCFGFLVESASLRSRKNELIPVTVVQTRDGLMNELRTWDRHLDVLESSPDTEPCEGTLGGTVARSRFHSTLIQTLLQDCLPNAAGTRDSSFDDQADRLLCFARDAIGLHDDGQGRRHFCLHLGVVAPLFLLALKTSRSDVLASCLDILAACKGRREGMYDAETVRWIIQEVALQCDELEAGSLLDQMGERAMEKLQEAVARVLPARDDGVRRMSALSRLLALIG